MFSRLFPRRRTFFAIFPAILLGALTFAARRAAASTITWGGIQWNVKSGTEMGPGPNVWSADNVFVDGSGDLHLAITNAGGTWTCAEVSTGATYGFGTYQWQVTTSVANLDPNVVLGLFVYGPLALGPDGTHEIDVEYARFGSADADSGRWTNWPNVLATPSLTARSSYPLALAGVPGTTSRFSWRATEIAFSTLAGFQPAGSNSNTIQSWTYRPADPGTTISQAAMPVHMNLWLYEGAPPTDGRGVEVVIHSFNFAASSSAVPALPRSGLVLLLAASAAIGLVALKRRVSVSRGG
ncbi:MAG: glycoside hydrolase family 16 protein [Pseudomonadota bacterium]